MTISLPNGLMDKYCNRCKETKPISEFGKLKANKDGFRNECKKCRKIYYQNNKEPIKAKAKEYAKSHVEQIAKVQKVYYQTHKEQILENVKQYRKNNYKKIIEYDRKRRKSKEYRAIINSQRRQKTQNDINYKLQVLLRSRLRKAVKRNQKTGSAIRDLGCSIEELKIWLENQFQPGMTWQNWGAGENDWHIDHIFPFHLCDLTKREDLLKVCHYTNLRPLWRKDNLSRTYEEFNDN